MHMMQCTVFLGVYFYPPPQKKIISHSCDSSSLLKVSSIQSEQIKKWYSK